MKKALTLIILFISTLIFLSTAASHCYVSGNTFTMPSDNKENNPYHIYRIDKNTDTSKYKENNKTKKSNNKNSNINNNYNTNVNIKSNNYNNIPDNNINKSNQKKFYAKNKNSNISYPDKKDKQDYNKPKNNPVKKAAFKKQNTNTITKIEFKKHFIKIKAGSSENILFTTVPAKLPCTGLIYKSNNNSVAVYKNNKLTGIEKGFTTILIMLKNGTVKAACPVKVI